MLQNCLRENSLTPFAEKHYSESPYSYCGGNPVNPMDPSGLDWYKTLNDVYACLSPEQMAALHLSEDGTLTSQLTGEVYHYLGPTMTITDARGNVYVGNQNCDVYRVKDVDQNTLTPPVNSGPSRFELTDIKAWKLSIIPNMSSLNRDNYMNINGIMCRYIQIPSLSPLAIPEFKGFVIPEITTEPLPGIDMKVDAIASDATSITTSTPMPNVSYSSEPTAFLSQGGGGGYSGGGNGGGSVNPILAAFTIEDTYNNFVYNHKTYFTTKGVEKNIFMANGAVRSERALQFARLSTAVKFAGDVGGVISTYNAGFNIQTNNGNPILNWGDALVGVAGLTNSAAGYLGGTSIPVIGEGVALYNWARFWGELGYTHPVSTWFIDNDFKSIIIR